MVRFLIIASVLGHLCSSSVAFGQSSAGHSLSTLQLERMLKKSPRLTIVDVRMENERIGEGGSMWGLKCSQCRTVRAAHDADLGFLSESALRNVPKSSTIIVVCSAGVRSLAAMKSLIELGYKPYNLRDGLRSLPKHLLYGAPPRVVQSQQ